MGKRKIGTGAILVRKSWTVKKREGVLRRLPGRRKSRAAAASLFGY
jgi:hypothetical protein